MTRVLGVDGARGGWVAASVEVDRTSGRTADVAFRALADIAAALATDAAAVGVDMPVGLPDTGRRECDLIAKALLGRAHSRVFLTPPRAVLYAAGYAEALLVHRRLVDGRGLSVQTWHLVPRMREVDAVAGDPRLVEVHPELSFAALAGQVLASKHTAAGRAQRLAVLRAWVPGLGETIRLPAGRTAGDALDALAAAWSAARWLAGTGRSLPDHPPVDGRGRPMRIVT